MTALRDHFSSWTQSSRPLCPEGPFGLRRRLETRCLHPLILVFASFTTVAGDNVGDFYDNRDGGHARISLADHPGAKAISSGLGVQLLVIEDRVVVGNASLAVDTPEQPSLVRFFLMDQAGATAAYRQYVGNNAYWYPEHRDHDQRDKYHAMTPAVSSSQGSSSSELDEVHKWFYTLAAFQPAVKDRLKVTGLLMPAIQMIFRRTRVASEDDYLSGAAHPSAFDDNANRAAMEAMAAGIRVDDVPPMVQLRVVEDGYDGVPGRDFFEAEPRDSELHYDTPVSIARIFRGREFTKRIVVSASESFDANQRPLTYHWRVLRGNPDGVRINPRNGDRSEVEILIDYHPETTIGGSTRLTSLAVVGAFVHNGAYYSAPAFVTSYTLNNEVRTYDPQTRRLLRTEYRPGSVDSRISTAKGWLSDTYVYDAAGELKGWIREHSDRTAQFTREGVSVVEGDINDVVRQTQLVEYHLEPGTNRLGWSPVPDSIAFPDGGFIRTATCGRFEARVVVSSSCDVSGISFGLAHDPSKVQAVDARPSGVTLDLRDGRGPEYWVADLNPAIQACAPGVAAGLVVSFVGSLADPRSATIPPGQNQEVATLVYRPTPAVMLGELTLVNFVDCLRSDAIGPAPVETVQICGDGARPVDTEGAKVFFIRDCVGSFLRGDGNGDGRFDISDPITVLLYLFNADRLPRPPTCLDAFDANDDGQIDLSDAITELGLLFRGTPRLPEPFAECGVDSTKDTLLCEGSSRCGAANP